MSDVWIRSVAVREDEPREPWHLLVSWITVDDLKQWTTACGQYVMHDVEEVRDRETVEHETTCFSCYGIQAREELREAGEEISDAPLAEDYEPQVLDPSHVMVDRGYGPAEGAPVGTMTTPTIDPDQERRAFVAGWFDGAKMPFTALDPSNEEDQAIAVQAYVDWKAGDE